MQSQKIPESVPEKSEKISNLTHLEIVLISIPENVPKKSPKIFSFTHFEIFLNAIPVSVVETPPADITPACLKISCYVVYIKCITKKVCKVYHPCLADGRS